jgi:hypothetical protein
MEQLTKKEDPKLFWEKHIQIKQSGGYGSGAEYCRGHNLSYSQYLYWQSKLKKTKSRQIAKFIPVSIKERTIENSAKQCEFYWPNGMCMAIYSQEALAGILRIVKDNMSNVSL